MPRPEKTAARLQRLFRYLPVHLIIDFEKKKRMHEQRKLFDCSRRIYCFSVATSLFAVVRFRNFSCNLLNAHESAISFYLELERYTNGIEHNLHSFGVCDFCIFIRVAVNFSLMFLANIYSIAAKRYQ